MIAIKNVLVATDFSPASDTALSYGRALARAFGSHLHILHVVDDLLTYSMSGEAALVGLIPGDLQAKLKQESRERLDRLFGDDDRRELQAKAEIRVSNRPAVEIVTYAKEQNINIIVLGTEGRGGIAHLLIGSVAEKVVRLSPCPVLTVHHPDREFIVPDALQRIQPPKA